MESYPLLSVCWNYLSISKLQRKNHWSLRIDMWYHTTLYRGLWLLTMLGLKLNHLSQRGPWLNLVVSIWPCPIQYDETLQDTIYVGVFMLISYVAAVSALSKYTASRMHYYDVEILNKIIDGGSIQRVISIHQHACPASIYLPFNNTNNAFDDKMACGSVDAGMLIFYCLGDNKNGQTVLYE